jgi:hypothetical protein
LVCQLYLSAIRSCSFLANERVVWEVLLQHGLNDFFATLVRFRHKIYVRGLLLNAKMAGAEVLLDDRACCQGSLTSHAQALLQVNFHSETLQTVVRNLFTTQKVFMILLKWEKHLGQVGTTGEC